MRPETRNPSRRNTTSLVTMLGAVMILCINVLASDEEEASGVFDYRVEMRREIRKKITELSAVPESDVPSHLDNIDDVSIRIPVAAGLILADQSRQNVVRYLAQRPSAQFDDFDLTFGPETQSLMIAEMFELLTSENPKVFEKAIRFLKHIDTILKHLLQLCIIASISFDSYISYLSKVSGVFE